MMKGENNVTNEWQFFIINQDIKKRIKKGSISEALLQFLVVSSYPVLFIIRTIVSSFWSVYFSFTETVGKADGCYS